jgi:hypothetical protein
LQPPPPHKRYDLHPQPKPLCRRRRIDTTIYTNTISSLLSAASIYDNSIYIAKLFVVTSRV